MNSIRAAIMRDASTKDSNLPASFIKLSSELLTEIIDVSLSSNADIINKSVSILKEMAEFINLQKKREDKMAVSHFKEKLPLDDVAMDNLPI